MQFFEKTSGVTGQASRKRAAAAFSLVELSIVLLILGLLTGGILAGQNLIRAAELRSVTAEFQTYQTAVMTFRDKYFQLPGDMTNATDFWGSSTACPGTAGTGTQTCNGDGNGSLAEATAASRYGEVFTFWQQLVNAGLLEGSYSGIAGDQGGDHHIDRINTPASRSGGAWAVSSVDPDPSSTSMFDVSYGNWFLIGQSGANQTPWRDAFTPEEAWNIDTKLDDGQPGQGSVLVRDRRDCTQDSGGATPAANEYDASYVLSESAPLCALVFRNAF